MISARFRRSFDSLDDVFGFTRRFYDREALPEDQRPAFDFCIEELFTNMVKYNRGNPNEIELALERRGDDLLARLIDFDVEPFDVTRAMAVDVDLPIEQREPGGLGLHLVRRLVDELAYDYTNRQSRVTVTKKMRWGMFDIRLGDKGEVVCEGRLDASQAARAQAFLDSLAAPDVVDMAKLEYISSAGLGVLLRTQKRLVAGGRGSAARQCQPAHT